MTNNLYGGGAEKVLQTVLNHLDYSKFQVTLCTLHETILPKELKGKVKLCHIFSHGCGKKGGRFLNFRLKLENKFKLIIYNKFSPRTFYRLFVKGKHDVEIAFIEGYSTRIVSGSTNRKSKKLAWVHIDMIENDWSKIAYQNKEEEKRCYQQFDVVACVSEVVKHSVGKLFNIGSKAKIVYNPIDEKLIIEKAKEKVSEVKNSDGIRFITLGRLEHQKGYDRLIPIIGRLKREGYNIELWIFGEGTQREQLEHLIKEHQLENDVKLFGFRSNPYSYFKYCDAFVCSSRNEGYSTAVTEALILGLPVVSTLCSGTEELLGSNSEYGIITANNEEGLYKGIKSITQKNILEEKKILAKNRGKIFQLKSLILNFENQFN